MKTSQLRKNFSATNLLFLFLFTLFTFSCVSIKPSTVQLSAEVGRRLSEMERIHQLALQRYFDMEKQKVEDFLANTWEPLFLKNFLGISGVLQQLQNASRIDDKGKSILKQGIADYLVDKTEAEKAATELVDKLSTSRKGEEGIVRTVLGKFVENNKLDEAVRHINALLGSDEPARIIIEFAEAAHQEMQAQRKEMLGPIELARAEATATLSEAYGELIRGQSTITGRLEAAARLSKQQDELLDKLGIGKVSNDLKEHLANVSAKVDGAISLARKEIEKENSIIPDKILDALKSALDKPKTDSLNKKPTK